MEELYSALLGAVAGAFAGAGVSYFMDRYKYRQSQTNMLRDAYLSRAEGVRKWCSKAIRGEIAYNRRKIKNAVIDAKRKLEQVMPKDQDDDPYYALRISEEIEQLDNVLKKIEEKEKKEEADRKERGTVQERYAKKLEESNRPE